MQDHDRILVMRHRQEATAQGLNQSKAGRLPNLDLSVDSGFENIDREQGGKTDEFRYRTSLRATQLLTDFGKTSLDVERAASTEARAQAELALTRRDVLLEGVSAWLGLLRAKQRLDYAKESVTSISEQVRIEERLRAQGAGLSSDVLQARAQLAGALAVANQFDGDMAVARNRFHNVFHAYPAPDAIREMTVPTGLENILPKSLDDAMARAAMTNAVLTLAGRELKLTEDEAEFQRAALWPRLELFGRLERRQDDDAVPGYRNDAAAGIQLTGNLFRGGGDQAAVRAAESRREAARANLDFVRRQVEEEVHNAWDLYLTAGGNAQHLKDQSRNLEDFLALARRERKMGTRSLLDLLNAEVAALSSRSSAAAAEMDRLLQACRLLHASGGLSVELFGEDAGKNTADGHDTGTPRSGNADGKDT